MAFDHDVVVIGSGFGGAVTACRLAEQGRKVLILERGRRWEVDDYPRGLADDWIWDQYIQSYPRAHHYDRYRPTAAHNKADFEAGAHGGNPLSQLRTFYKQRVAQQ